MKLPEYAVYKGEEIIFIGNVREIAEEFNVKKETVRFCNSPVNKRRLANRKGGNSQGKLAIRIEDEL
jgi:hypothetical protein